MLIKLFVLGRPGTGKTTAFHLLAEEVDRSNWSVTHVRDYEILYAMADAEATKDKFEKLVGQDGFDVKDFSVLDTALQELERNVRDLEEKYQNSPEARSQHKLAIIEFARDDYKTALKLFTSPFLQSSHILFISANLNLCMERIHRRALYSSRNNNHVVSDKIMQSYYAQENRFYIEHNLRHDYDMKTVIEVVENNASVAVFNAKIKEFFAKVLIREDLVLEEKKRAS